MVLRLGGENGTPSNNKSKWEDYYSGDKLSDRRQRHSDSICTDEEENDSSLHSLTNHEATTTTWEWECIVFNLLLPWQLHDYSPCISYGIVPRKFIFPIRRIVGVCFPSCHHASGDNKTILLPTLYVSMLLESTTRAGSWFPPRPLLLPIRIVGDGYVPPPFTRLLRQDQNDHSLSSFS